MIRLTWVIALGCLWTSAACAQTTDGRTSDGPPAVDLARGVGAALPAEPLDVRADSLVRAGRP